MMEKSGVQLPYGHCSMSIVLLEVYLDKVERVAALSWRRQMFRSRGVSKEEGKHVHNVTRRSCND